MLIALSVFLIEIQGVLKLDKMIDVKERIDKRKAEGFNTANITVKEWEERSHVTSELKQMGYEYEVKKLLRPKSEGETYKITVELPPDELGAYHKTVVLSSLIDLIGIMEGTDDPSTKERLNEQITHLMNELNLMWEDM